MTRMGSLDCFLKYTASSFDKVYHQYIVIEWKANINKAAYKDKHNMGVLIPSKKRKCYWSMNVDHLPIWLLNEIDWPQLQEI